LTELDAAEGQQNRWLYLKGGNENGGNTIAMSLVKLKMIMQNRTGFSRQMAYARFCRHEGIMISTLFASSKFVTNRNHFQVIAETGPTGQLHYDGMANGGQTYFRYENENKNENDSFRFIKN